MGSFSASSLDQAKMRLVLVAGWLPRDCCYLDVPLIEGPSIQQSMNVWGELDHGADIGRSE
jgi:hypothetical protein